MNDGGLDGLVELKGVVSKVLFSKDNFLIAELNVGKKERVKIKGSLYGVKKGEDVVVRGRHETHVKYGQQFAVERWERPIPQTKNQIITFLSSSLIKGCSHNQAIRIYEKLGDDAIEIISKEGESSLDGIRGIGSKRSSSIVDSIRSTFEVQKVISALLVYGITVSMAMKAYEKFESNTVEKIEENPYNLVQLNLVGFLKADEIARNMGIMPTSFFRIESCVDFVLKETCFKSGHCFVNEADLIKSVELALNHNSIGEDVVSREEVQIGINNLDDIRLVIEGDSVYPKFLFYHEDQLARKLSQMKGSRSGEALSDFGKLITSYQKKNGIILAQKQREAIELLFSEQLLVLTGGPGTGKTTVIKTMLDVFKDAFPKAVITLVAPTGRASRQLAEVTGMDASTIHRTIGYVQGDSPQYDRDNSLDADLLIVDEMSMVDVQLANMLLQAVSNDTRILFVGDIDQLPSVNPGNVLSDMIDAGIPTIRLTEVFRQAQESQIVSNAHRINKGQSIRIDQKKEDFYFITKDEPESVANTIIRSVARFINLGHSISDILVLSPMKKGPAGTIALNEAIRDQINPFDPNKAQWVMGEKIVRVDDKIIQLKNNTEKGVYNGDIGIVMKIEKQLKNGADQPVEILTCDFGGRIVNYERGEFNQIDLAYAITIHKSQGGESPIVIIPIITSHYVMLARNLIYTGLTRAKFKMVFVGTLSAMNTAIANNKISDRNSNLSMRIKGFGKKTDSHSNSQVHQFADKTSQLFY